MVNFIQQGEEFGDLTIVERLNGGSRPGENELAVELCEKGGYAGIGGSDAHLTSHIATCLTRFPGEINRMEELVEALQAGGFRPVRLEDTATVVP